MREFNCRFSALCFFLVCYCFGLTQNAVNDSLLIELKKAKHDTDKLKLLTEIAWNYSFSDLKKSREYAGKELELAQKTNNQKYVAAAYNDLGIVLMKESKLKEALELHKMALSIRLKLPSQLDIASSYSKIGYCYVEMLDYVNSLNVSLKALDIYVKLKNKRYQAYMLNTICSIYSNLKNYDKLIMYATRSYALANECNDKAGVAAALNFMAVGYINEKKYDVAIEKRKRAYQLYAEVADSINMAAVLNNLGDINRLMYRDKEALPYYLQALVIARKIRNTNSEAMYTDNIGGTYLALKQYDLSEKYLKKGHELARAQAMSDVLLTNYYSYGELYARTGRTDEAVKCYNKYIQLKDSLFSNETLKQLSEMEVKYETRQKEEENIILSKENNIKSLEIKQQKTQRNILFAGFSLLLLLGIFIYNSTRLKSRNKILIEKELRTRAVFEAQEKEKIHLSKELHDGLGPLLSLIKMNVSTLKPEPENQKTLSEIKDLTNESIKEVRTISHALMPSLLQKQGLQTALADFTEQINKAGHLKTTFNFEVFTKLQPETEAHIYRIVQEAVNNTMKHAEATHTKINLTQANDIIDIIIEDNGKGFAGGKEAIVTGNGLNNIYSRVDFLKGQIHIDTSVEKGTKLKIQIPANELRNG